MALGILNTMVPILWQYHRFLQDEGKLLSNTRTETLKYACPFVQVIYCSVYVPGGQLKDVWRGDRSGPKHCIELLITGLSIMVRFIAVFSVSLFTLPLTSSIYLVIY